MFTTNTNPPINNSYSPKYKKGDNYSTYYYLNSEENTYQLFLRSDAGSTIWANSVSIRISNFFRGENYQIIPRIIPTKGKAALKAQLINLFKVDSVESGITHPVQALLLDYITHYVEATNWIQEIFVELYPKMSSTAADLVRCLGRLDASLVSSWGRLLPIVGLMQRDIEVREASVEALEMWGGEESLNLLKLSVDGEKVGWLKDYMSQVIIDLEN